MLEKLEKCTICPHMCKINRFKNIGKCKSDSNVKVALSSLHYFEEPCISGSSGSGTIFFSNCNLNCIYCQNYQISQEGIGTNISIKELSDLFLTQQSNGANNINLVTPTSYVYQIVEALKLAKSQGLTIPIIYNTNSFENIDTLKYLEGYIDVYLPDLKYYSDDLAKKYSNVTNYFSTATAAILEMVKQVGLPQFDNNGIIQKGVIIRHLVLPGHIQNSKHILKWLKNNIDGKAYVSIMAQYFPTYKSKYDPIINRKLNNKEYKEIENFLYTLDLKNGYIQDLGKHEEEYVPKFL